MDRYKIIRFYASGSKRTMDTGLTLEEAQTHCQDPETSSKTAKKNTSRVAWFDGYEKM